MENNTNNHVEEPWISIEGALRELEEQPVSVRVTLELIKSYIASHFISKKKLLEEIEGMKHNFSRCKFHKNAEDDDVLVGLCEDCKLLKTHNTALEDIKRLLQ